MVYNKNEGSYNTIISERGIQKIRFSRKHCRLCPETLTDSKQNLSYIHYSYVRSGCKCTLKNNIIVMEFIKNTI